MNVILWILAIISLAGGIYLGMEENDIWYIYGIVSFAVLGGFASIVSLLKEISTKLSDMDGALALQRSEKKDNHQESSSAPADTGRSVCEGQAWTNEKDKNDSGSAQPLNDTPHIFYCKNCGAAYGGTSESKPEKCSKCDGPVAETTISRDVWRTFSNEQKIQALLDAGILSREEYDEKKRSLTNGSVKVRKTCPSCGSANPGNNKFCVFCGENLMV